MSLEKCINVPQMFVIEDFFNGKTKAWGMFEDRFGNVRKQFSVEIDGRWDGKVLRLEENFTYIDGELEKRIWTIKKEDGKKYKGYADDIIGTALGECHGNTLTWQYDMKIKINDRSINVHFNDRMYLQPEGVLLSKARVSKLGVEIGVVTLTFIKNKPNPAPENYIPSSLQAAFELRSEAIR